jgi:hypothetical protein
MNNEQVDLLLAQAVREAEPNELYKYRFAKLVAAHEREACAQIAHNTYEGFGVDAQGVDFVKQRIIIAIRERGAP